MMSADLPPDVRAEASRGVNRAMRTKQAGAAVTLEMLHAVVQAVTAVVAPEIERPLQARVEELSTTLRAMAWRSISRGRQRDGLEADRDQLLAENDALQARVAELDTEVAARKRSGEALNTECEQIGEKADEAWRALNPYMARVELLTAALTRLVDAIAPGDVPDGALRNARAALAAGKTESEGP